MAPPPPKPRVPAALLGAGVLVVVVGFGLPRLLTTNEAAPPAADDPGLRWSLVKLGACFALVCGGLVAAVKIAAGRTPPKPGSTRVLASLSLDGRCVVQLVKAGDRRLLVGIDPGGVKALLELPGPAPEPAPEPPATPVAESPRVVGPFKVTVPAADEPPLAEQIAAVIARITHDKVAR